MLSPHVAREEVLRVPPRRWHHPARGLHVSGVLAVLGVVLIGMVVGAGTGTDELLGTGFDGWTLVVLPALLLGGGGLAALQQATWRSTVDGRDRLRVGGALRRREVDLTALRSVSLRPEGAKRDPRSTVKLVVEDTSDRRVTFTLGWHPLSWESWHLIAWHAVQQRITLSGPTRMALALSDSPVQRQLLDVASPPVTGPVTGRYGPRLVGATLFRWWLTAFIAGYAATLRPVDEWPRWMWLLPVVAVFAALYGLAALLRRPRQRLTVDADGYLRAPDGEVDLTGLALVDMGPDVPEGVWFERLAHLGVGGMPEPTDRPVGNPVLRVEDDAARQVAIALTDRWEPMGALASRLLHAVDTRDLEVSEAVRYNLRFAAGQVPLHEHRQVVADTTGVDPVQQQAWP